MQDEPETAPDRVTNAATPRWVKVFGIVALAVVVLFVVLLIARGGDHGPGRHTAVPEHALP